MKLVIKGLEALLKWPRHSQAGVRLDFRPWMGCAVWSLRDIRLSPSAGCTW